MYIYIYIYIHIYGEASKDRVLQDVAEVACVRHHPEERRLHKGPEPVPGSRNLVVAAV